MHDGTSRRMAESGETSLTFNRRKKMRGVLYILRIQSLHESPQYTCPCGPLKTAHPIPQRTRPSAITQTHSEIPNSHTHRRTYELPQSSAQTSAQTHNKPANTDRTTARAERAVLSIYGDHACAALNMRVPPNRGSLCPTGGRLAAAQSSPTLAIGRRAGHALANRH